MTKDKDSRAELVWRLKEQPSTDKLRELVKDEIISKDEARQILFSEGKNLETENKALKEQITFLEDALKRAIDKLGSGWTYTYPNTWTWHYPFNYWYTSLPKNTCSMTHGSGTMLSTGTYSINTASNTINLGSTGDTQSSAH